MKQCPHSALAANQSVPGMIYHVYGREHAHVEFAGWAHAGIIRMPIFLMRANWEEINADDEIEIQK